MKKRFISVATFCAVLASTSVWVGCSDYDDDIQNLQGQITANATDLSAAIDEKVNALTQEINNLKSQEEALSTALETAKAELNEAIADAKTYADAQAEAARVAAIEAAQAEVKAAREALETSLAEANAKIEGLNTTVNGQAEQIAALLDADKTMEQSIAEANAAIEAANTAIEEVRGLANANSEELTKLNEDLAAVADNLKTVETNLSGQIASLGERVDEAYNQIAANKADAEKQLAQVNSLIKANSDLIAALQEKDEALDAKDAELLADIIENTNGLADLAEKLTAAEELCEQNLVAAKGYTDAQLALLKTSLGLTDETSIDLPAAITRLGAAEEAIAGIKENIAELAEKDEELQGLIDAVEESVAGITAQVGTIAEQVNKNTEAIKQNAEAIGANAESIALNAEGIKKLEELTTKLQEDLGKLEASTAENLKAEIEKVMANFQNYATTAAMNQLKETLSADYAKADETLATTLRGELAQSVKDLQEQIDAINLSDFQTQIDNLTGKTDEEIKALKQKLADDYDDLKTQIGLIMGESGAIETVNEAIDGVAERVTKLETELPTLTKNVTDLTGRMDAVENEINMIYQDIVQNAAIVRMYVSTIEDSLSALVGYTSQLRSIVFSPELYYQGIEAIGVWSYNYTALKFENETADPTKDQSKDYADETTNKVSVVPEVTASYYLNPSNAAIDLDASNFKVLLNPGVAVMRAIGEDDISVAKVEKDADDNGKINVTFKMSNADNISQGIVGGNEGKIDVMALRYKYSAESGDTVVTSDFAALKQFVIKGFAINKVYMEGGTDAPADAHDFHLATTAQDAINALENDPDIPYLEIEYNDEDGLDLNQWINVHYKMNGSTTETTWGGQAEINKKNFKLKYELIGFFADDTDQTSESERAQIDPETGILTLKVEEGTTGRNNIGRTPLVRVSLIDGNSNNQIAAVGYILVKITDVNAGNLVAEDNQVIVKDYTVKCGEDLILDRENAITWKEVEEKVLGQLDMSKEQFEKSYQVDLVPGGSTCQQYARQNDTFSQVEGIGDVSNTGEPGSHETQILKWSVNNVEAYQQFVTLKKTTVTTWVCFEPRNGYGSKIYVELTWTPANVNAAPQAEILDGDKKRADWHATDSREQGYDELHIQVGNATVPEAECEYGSMVVEDRFNNKPLDVIKRDLGSTYAALANVANVTYKFAPTLEQKKRSYKGASGTDYVISVSADGLTISSGGFEIAKIEAATGKIMLCETPVAKDIINGYGSLNDLANALTLTVTIENETCPPADGIEWLNESNELNVKVIKPIFISGGEIGEMTLNDNSTLTQKLKLSFVDFNGYNPQTFYDKAGTKGTTFWNFYGVTSIELDRRPGKGIQTNYTGIIKPFDPEDFEVTFTAPTTGSISLDNMGTVKLDQGENMSRANDFNVYLNLKVSYKWGDLYTQVTLHVNAAPGE